MYRWISLEERPGKNTCLNSHNGGWEEQLSDRVLAGMPKALGSILSTTKSDNNDN